MKNVKMVLLILAISLLPIVAGCGNQNQNQEIQKPAPFTNIPPAPEKGAGAPDFK